MGARGGSRMVPVVAAVLALVSGLVDASPANSSTPPNDDIANAVAVTLPYQAAGTTAGATVDPDDPVGTLGGSIINTVWYRITPEASTGVLVRLTVGTLDAPCMVAWIDMGGDPMREIAWEQLTYDGAHADLWFHADAGSTYYLQLGNVPGSPGGTYAVSMTPTDAMPAAADPVISFPVRQLSMAGDIPLMARWVRVPAEDGSRVWNSEVELSTDGGPWISHARTSMSSVSWRGQAGHTYRFRVRVVDEAGRWSSWATSETVTPALYQETSQRAGWSGTWHRSGSQWSSGGTARYSTTRGSTVTFTFTGRAVGVVGVMQPTRGRVRAYVDGIYVRRIDFGKLPANARWGSRTIRWCKVWPETGTHTLKLVVEGTPGRHRVDIDGFVILR